LAAIRSVSRSVGTPPDHLLMADYARHTVDDPSLPPVGEALLHFGTWRRARRLAAATAEPDRSA
jgi:hypothetical protein